MIGRPGVIHLTPGNASDVKTAPAVLARAPGRVRRLIADKGYDADWLRQDLREQGISMVIPGTRARKRKMGLRLPRIGGHRERFRVRCVCHAENPSPVPGGVPPPDGRVGPRRTRSDRPRP